MKKLICFLFSLLVFNLLGKYCFAAVRCETQYGGSQVCVSTGELQINKKIWDPQRNTWVDNLFINDYKFKTGEVVKFKLIIKNIGNNDLHNVKVVDTLPSFLFFTGTTPSEFSWSVLGPGVTEEKEVEARVVSESQLTANQDCDVNTAEVTSDEGEKDKDTAKLCVVKQVLGVSTLPKTGPTRTLPLFLSAIIALFIGAILKIKKIA